jgi:uncharacterized protein YbaP (TraB family)
MKKMVLAIALSLALAACAATPEQSADQQAAANEPAQPALWAIRDADSTMYFYGTVHMRRPGASWGGPAAARALSVSDEVWTELQFDPATEATLQQKTLELGVDPTSKLSDKLDDAMKPKFVAAAESLGLPPAALEPLRPWLASITLSVTALIRAGYDPMLGVDRTIDAESEAMGKTMRWFESGEQQLGFLAGLSEPVQLQMLAESIEQASEGVAQMKALESAWERGDIEELGSLLDEGWDAYPELYEVLITRRNAAWAETLKDELNGAGVDFIAVGAAHLLGEDSVLRMLEDAGYTVEHVTPEAR